MNYKNDEFVKTSLDEIEASLDRLANYLVFHGADEGLSFDDFLDFEKRGHGDILEDREQVFFSAVARAIKMDHQLRK